MYSYGDTKSMIDFNFKTVFLIGHSLFGWRPYHIILESLSCMYSFLYLLTLSLFFGDRVPVAPKIRVSYKKCTLDFKKTQLSYIALNKSKVN